MDSLSAEIRNLQFKTNEIKVKNDSDNYELSFPEDNFNYLFSTKMAYHVSYKKTGTEDVLTLIDSVDLSIAIAAEIEFIKNEAGNDLGKVKLWFPKDSLHSKFYIEGNQINKKSDDFISFYFMDNSNLEIHWKMLNLVVAICNSTKIDNKTLIEEEAVEAYKQFLWLKDQDSHSMLSYFEEFIKKFPKSLYKVEIQKIQRNLIDIKNKEIQRAKEVSEGLIKITMLSSMGKDSYKNYKYYGEADSLAVYLLAHYTAPDFKNDAYYELKHYRNELKERHKWNKEYFLKRDEILAYDSMMISSIELSKRYSHKMDIMVNGTLYLKASLLALGGMATGVGIVLFFTEGEGVNLMKYGGIALGIGSIWAIIQNRDLKKAERKASEAQKKTSDFRLKLGAILEKRNESLAGVPLININ